MTIETGNQELEDILNEYVASPPGPGKESLAEWIRRYPQYEHELTEFTVSWSRLKWIDPPSEPSIPEETLVLRGMSIVQNLLFAQQSEQRMPPEAPSIQGILAEGKSQGLNLFDIANASHLGVGVVRKLDRRLIQYPMPQQVIERLAHVLKCPFQAIARYLQGPRRFPTHAQYHAEQAPMLAEQEEFFVALRNDQTTPEEWREEWLLLASADK